MRPPLFPSGLKNNVPLKIQVPTNVTRSVTGVEIQKMMVARTSSKQRSKDRAHNPDLRQLPLYRCLRMWRIVICNGNGAQVGEQRDEDDEVGTDGLVEDNHGDGKVYLEM